MNNLKKNHDIIYMWEDKGSSFTKMTKEQYLKAGEMDLESESYINVPNDPSKKVKADNDTLVTDMLMGGEISEKVAKYLLSGDKKLSNYYHLLKTHKIPTDVANPFLDNSFLS